MTDREGSAVAAYLRGVAWPAAEDGGPGGPYPRADPADARRLPADTWAAAQLPVGVRLELTGTARAVDLSYRCATADLGYRGAGAGTAFSVWHAGQPIGEQAAELAGGTVRLEVGGGTERTIVYLPEGMRPVITGLRAVDGHIEPASPQPRWIAYGDSITEGWVATSPAGCWTARASRQQSLDVINLGYAGSARGEIPTAQQIASLDSDVISVAYGTNCWSMIPHSAAMMRANAVAFLRIVRSGHPGVPVVVISPITRPDAEDQANVLGATLAALRAAIEEGVNELDDELISLIPGADLVPAALLADGIHPGDAGHAVLADVIGPVLAKVLQCRSTA